MSLKHVLLVYLESGASTGYDIVKGFRGSFGYLWNASYQQVYRDLSRLHEDDLISCKTEPAIGRRPARKLYQLTDQGRQALQQWLSTPVKLPRYNDAFMVKVASAHLMQDKRPLLEELRANRVRYQRYLEGLESYQTLFESLPEDSQRQYRCSWLSLKRGIEVNRSWLNWSYELESTLLEDMQTQPTVQASNG